MSDSLQDQGNLMNMNRDYVLDLLHYFASVLVAIILVRILAVHQSGSVLWAHNVKTKRCVKEPEFTNSGLDRDNQCAKFSSKD